MPSGVYKRIKPRFTSEETKKKISESRIGKYCGEEHYNWKGKNAKYRAVHMWVQRMLGKAKYCVICNKTDNRIHWANIDHKYKRNTEDYLSLCYKCHAGYDKKHNLRKHKTTI